MSDDNQETFILAKQGSITLVGNVLGRGLGFLFVMMMTRMVSPSIYGTFTLSLSIVMFLQGFFSVSLHRSIDYFVPQNLDEDEFAQAKGAIVNVTLIAGIATTIGAVALVLSSGLIAGLFGKPMLADSLPLFCLLLPLYTIKKILLTTANSIKNMKIRVWVKNVVDPFVRVSVAGLLLMLGFGLAGIITGYLFGVLTAVAVGTLLLYKKAGWIWTSTTQSVSRKKLLSYSFPLVFAGIIYSIVGQVDYFVIGYFLTSSDVGYYRVGYLLSMNLLIILSAVTPIFKPTIAENQDNHSTLIQHYQLATRWITLLTIPIALTLVIAPGTYLSLFFTSEYTVASFTVVVLSLGYLTNALLGPEGITLKGLGHTRLTLVNTIILVVVNTTLDLVLVPEFGILGAAIGTATALTLSGIVGVVQLGYLHGINPYTRDLLLAVSSGLPVLVLGKLIVRFLPNGIGRAVLLPIFILFTYAVALRIVGGLTEKDARLLAHIDEKIGYPVAETLLFGEEGFTPR